MMASALYAGYPQAVFATANEVQAVMQSDPVKGQVVDENGSPVIGATVMMKGTSKGAITDLNGNFTLENATKGTLVISYIGYITEEVQTNGQGSVNVVLKEDTKRLDEVVVVGYGTQRKEELSSSVMSVKSSEFVQATKPDVAGLIRGKVAGLAVISPDANPLSTSQVSLHPLPQHWLRAGKYVWTLPCGRQSFSGLGPSLSLPHLLANRKLK